MEKNKNSLAVIKRTFEVIDYIFENNGKVSFSDIQNSLSIPKATTFRIVSTLEEEGIIRRIHEYYHLGNIFAYYGEAVKSEMTLLSISENILRDLAKTIGESVNLHIFYKDIVLNIASFKGEYSVLSSGLISIAPLNCSSTGKLFLANKNPELISEYFSSGKVERRTKNSIVDYNSFMEIRDELLEKHIAYDDEEYEYGLFCIGIPITDYLGRMVAGVSISGPKARIQMKGIECIREKLGNSVDLIIEILNKSKLDIR